MNLTTHSVEMTCGTNTYQSYDHRLKNFIAAAGNAELIADLGIPRSTAGYWVNNAEVFRAELQPRHTPPPAWPGPEPNHAIRPARDYRGPGTQPGSSAGPATGADHHPRRIMPPFDLPAMHLKSRLSTTHQHDTRCRIIESIDCDAGTDLPASCHGVIIVNGVWNRKALRLATGLPLKIKLLDLEYTHASETKSVVPEKIVSIPFRAFWKGFADPSLA